MIDELRDLYQEVILDHSKHPRNFGKISTPTHKGEGHNPICGDHVILTLKIEKDHVNDIKFEGSACAICTASSSIMTDIVKSLPLSVLPTLFEYFQKICTQNIDPSEHPIIKNVDETHFTKMAILSGVTQFPMRVKCATLAWHTLMAALSKKDETSTE